MNKGAGGWWRLLRAAATGEREDVGLGVAVGAETRLRRRERTGLDGRLCWLVGGGGGGSYARRSPIFEPGPAGLTCGPCPSRAGPGPCGGGAGRDVKRLACDSTRRRVARVRGELRPERAGCEGGSRTLGRGGSMCCWGRTHVRSGVRLRSRAARCQTTGPVPALRMQGGAGDRSGDGGDAGRRGGAVPSDKWRRDGRDGPARIGAGSEAGRAGSRGRGCGSGCGAAGWDDCGG